MGTYFDNLHEYLIAIIIKKLSNTSEFIENVASVGLISERIENIFYEDFFYAILFNHDKEYAYFFGKVSEGKDWISKLILYESFINDKNILRYIIEQFEKEGMLSIFTKKLNGELTIDDWKVLDIPDIGYLRLVTEILAHHKTRYLEVKIIVSEEKKMMLVINNIEKPDNDPTHSITQIGINMSQLKIIIIGMLHYNIGHGY